MLNTSLIMAWQPSPESLQTLAVYLKDSLSGFNKDAQKKAEIVRLPILLAIQDAAHPNKSADPLCRCYHKRNNPPTSITT